MPEERPWLSVRLMQLTLNLSGRGVSVGAITSDPESPVSTSPGKTQQGKMQM